MSKLQAILESMHIYQATYSDDACIIVANTEEVIGYIPGKQIDINVQLGMPFNEFANTATGQAIQLGERIQKEQTDPIRGIPIISTASPIIEDGKIVGAFSAIVSNKKIHALRTGTAELSATVEEMTATTEQITKDSDDVFRHLQELSVQSQSVLNEIKKIDSILKFIDDISSQSHMLGLNAAIEAARAGEHGRGFTVVANETRKMAAESKEASKKIKAQLQYIQEKISEMDHSIRHISEFTEEHSVTMRDLNTSFAHIASTAENLSNFD